MEKDHEFQKRFTKIPEYVKIYESKMASSLIASTMIGNLYTASLYLGFRSTLEFEYQKGVKLESKRFGFGSYGSGSSAMIFSGVVQPEYEKIVSRMNLEEDMGTRTRLTLEQYEQVHKNKLGILEPILEPKKEFVLTQVNTSPEFRGERRYVYKE